MSQDDNEKIAEEIRKKFPDYGEKAEQDTEHYIPIYKYSGYAYYDHFRDTNTDGPRK